MELKRKLYSISETEELLSLTPKELGVLVNDGELRRESMITAESILAFAKQKNIKVRPESESEGG